MPADWDEVRQRLFDRVFYAFDERDVEASQDLHADGFLDSLAVLVTLGVLDEELGEGVAVEQARVSDTASMATLRELYLRLRDRGESAQ
ncbi:hypothetical protein H7J88_26340 [Mycolicibacterium flavescens]|uniref:Carrier domain-containing protein n=1 Tax=Mycolicibacterium flavescens TaxID=1776 RepID=A0A1E3RH41_MYCFV|nr:hypothetical protein [Mycolicibacterium flavescens]MCV7283159.1 hypothetical protein [Mycolicibacterium flavescens]ODQ89195.1 hypothetical protein BHQ18_16570 [Mycolicibacterium flavescens]